MSNTDIVIAHFFISNETEFFCLFSIVLYSVTILAKYKSCLRNTFNLHSIGKLFLTEPLLKPFNIKKSPSFSHAVNSIKSRLTLDAEPSLCKINPSSCVAEVWGWIHVPTIGEVHDIIIKAMHKIPNIRFIINNLSC